MVRKINAFNESCSPNLVFKWEFWFHKDWVIFGLKNWLWNLKMPYFCQLRLKLSYKIWTNPFRMFIRVQKSIEFHLPPYEIPQPLSHYYLCYKRIQLTDHPPTPICLRSCWMPPSLVRAYTETLHAQSRHLLLGHGH